MTKQNFLSVIQHNIGLLMEQSKPILPLGIHAWPKNGDKEYVALGPVNWGKSTESWLDIFVGSNDHLYQKYDGWLFEICQELGIPYIYMG